MDFSMDEIGVFFFQVQRRFSEPKNHPLSMLISKFFVEKISPLRIFLQIHIRG